MVTLYETIEGLCRINEINVSLMCRESGVSRASMTDLKKGRSQTLTAETLSRIAAYFHVTVDFLMDDDDDKFYFLGQGDLYERMHAKTKKPTQTGELVNDDAELTAYIQDLKDRPEMRMLFSLTHNATREDVERAVRVIEAIRNPRSPEQGE